MAILILVLLTGSCASPRPDRVELRVLSAVGMKQALLALAPRFERSTGVTLVTSFDSGAVIGKRVAAGDEAVSSPF